MYFKVSEVKEEVLNLEEGEFLIQLFEINGFYYEKIFCEGLSYFFSLDLYLLSGLRCGIVY